MWNRTCSISVTVICNIILKRREISDKPITTKWKISVLMIPHVMSVLKCVQPKLIWNTVRTPHWWNRKFSSNKKRMKYWLWTRRFIYGYLFVYASFFLLSLLLYITKNGIICYKWEPGPWLRLCAWRTFVTGFLRILFLIYWIVKWGVIPMSRQKICVGW